MVGILASKYKSCTCVGFIHPVIARHDYSPRVPYVCASLAHTGAAYPATEYHKPNNIVLIRFAFVPHFELASFFRRLFLIANFIIVLCICSMHVLLVVQCSVRGDT